MLSTATLTRTNWLIDPRHAPALLAAMRGIATGENRQLAEPSKGRNRKADVPKVAVLSISGTVFNKPSLLQAWLGGTAMTEFSADLKSALADPAVTAIAVMIDSPGGEAVGLPEAAQLIYEGRQKKPIIALTDGMACSAAFWLATACTQFFMTDSAETGSVGAFSIAWDETGAMEKDGVKAHIIRAPKGKAELNPYESPTPEALAFEQDAISKLYSQFVAAVAKYRGTSPSNVMQNFGQGRVVDSDHATRYGMVDGKTTREAFVDKMIALATGPADSRKSLLVEPSWKAENETERMRSRLKAKGILNRGPRKLATVECFVVPWNSPSPIQDRDDGQYREVVSPEAFDEVLNGAREVVVTQDHQRSRPIAKRSEFAVRLAKRRAGLFADVDVPNTEAGRELLDKIRAGKATGCSFSTASAASERIQFVVCGDIQARLLERGELCEFAIMTEPSYPTFPETWCRIKA